MTESELQEAFRASVAKAEQEAAERQKNETIDTLTKVMSGAYSQAMAYTNVVIIAGYAAAFTIWNFTRAYLPESTVFVDRPIAYHLCGRFCRLRDLQDDRERPES